ncbi:MAG: PHP domain-containing protein [Treponema sp.]|jgi:predicted metal-dependent phosphoesterase TrpH|nr:PHP domain-containing protein [Treponema sp.]
MKSKVNLHVHTKYSDGGKTVSEAVSELKEAGIEYFSITDHDTVDGNFEAANYAEKYGMKYFNGIELSCRFINGELGFDDLCGCHILGLGINANEMKIKLIKLSENKDKNARILYELMLADGYNLESIKENPTLTNIRNELVAKGYATDKKECKKKILYADKYRQYANLNMSVQMAIQTIKECGGFAIWAHPFKAPGFARREELNKEQIPELLDLMCTYGIDGIEAYYQHLMDDYTAEQIKFLESLAHSKKLFKSIGTDYHHKEIKDNIFFDVEGIIPDEAIIACLESRMES